jgi:hypothetical protein
MAFAEELTVALSTCDQNGVAAARTTPKQTRLNMRGLTGQ